MEKEFHVYQQGTQSERDYGDDSGGDFSGIFSLHNLEQLQDCGQDSLTIRRSSVFDDDFCFRGHCAGRALKIGTG